MNPNNSQEEFIEELDADNPVSIDDFIRELEEKEKDLHISVADTVFEIEESDAYPDLLEKSVYSTNIATFPEAPENSFTAPPRQVAEKPDSQAVEMKKRIAELEKEREDLREVLLRRQSDFDNYRKRTERERDETKRNLVANLINKMLPVVDNLGRALDSANELSGGKTSEFQDFINGIAMVNRQLIGVLADWGVEPIFAVGEPFDPYFHEAVAIEQNLSVPPNTVTEEILRGYKMGDKIIRHAMVKVSEGGNPVPHNQNMSADDESFLDLEIEKILGNRVFKQ